MNELKEPQTLTGLYTFVSDVHKEGTGHLSPFFGGAERGNKLQRHLTNFLLGPSYSICECLDALVLFSYSCAVKIKIFPKETTCFFLGYAQSGYRCYDVKSKRLNVSILECFL